MELEHVLSNDLTPQEEERIKLHKEIKERLITYEKMNLKLQWQLEDINQQVEEQIELRDNMIKKYAGIFASIESKLEQLELDKRQSIKHSEDIIKEQNIKMVNEMRTSFVKGTTNVVKQCDVINEGNLAVGNFIDALGATSIDKQAEIKSIRNEYLIKQQRSLYLHKERIQQIHERGQKKVDEYWQQKFHSNRFETDHQDGMTYQQIKDQMVSNLKYKKDELRSYEQELLSLNEILKAQNQIVEKAESSLLYYKLLESHIPQPVKLRPSTSQSSMQSNSYMLIKMLYLYSYTE